jgi:hypothetical protein
MSQRLGMADGRCLTLNQSNQLLYESIAHKLKVNPLDSGLLRQTLQNQDIEYFPSSDVPCGIINYGSK